MVTAYYANRADQFLVDFPLYHQFPRQKEREALAARPYLAGSHQLLVNLLEMEVRHRLYRPKT